MDGATMRMVYEFKPRERKYPFGKMNVGDTLFVEPSEGQSVHHLLNLVRKASYSDKKVRLDRPYFQSRIHEENGMVGVLCTRIR